MVKLSINEEKLISDLSKTSTVREVGRALLSYMTVEQMSKFVATYLVFKSKGLEREVLDYFSHDQFFPLLKIFTLSIGDLIPEFVTDKEFMKLYFKIPKRLSFEKKQELKKKDLVMKLKKKGLI